MSDDAGVASSTPSSGIQDVIRDTFDYQAHRTAGSSADALDWVASSSLPEDDKAALRTFVERFPEAVFYRDDAVLLDHLEQRNVVALPLWLRESRQVLSGLGPAVSVRFDEFDYYTPRADRIDDNENDEFIDLWYDDRFQGYLQDEDRILLGEGARSYPIFSAVTEAEYLLAADLRDPTNKHIVDFCNEDIMDNRYEGKPGTASVYPAITSYASMLSHIVEYRTAEDTVIRAQGLS